MSYQHKLHVTGMLAMLPGRTIAVGIDLVQDLNFQYKPVAFRIV